MAASRAGGPDFRRRRRWSFGACTFDEAQWLLTVDGERVTLETKPLELLRELLVRAGAAVSKDELLDRVWPDVTVVEASLPTAIYKLRAALRDDRRERAIIETVPGIGYRLAVPVEVEEPPLEAGMPIGIAKVAAKAQPRLARRLLMAGGAAVAAVAVTFALIPSRPGPATRAFTQKDAANALRKLDVDAIEELLAAGWDPNVPVEAEGNAALHYTAEICEWDPEHDRNRMVLMVRTLYEGGAQLYQRNVWGDTVYSIAKSPRYCGPDHPLTRGLRATCSTSEGKVMDRCLASYELARRRTN